MAIRFRKSFKVAPGVKVNLGKKSAGVSFGNKYFRKTYSTSGRKTTSSSIPGTGITFMDTKTKSKKKKKVSANKAQEDVFFEEVKGQAPQTEVDHVVETSDNVSEPQPKKMKFWPWFAMAAVLLVLLGALLGNNTPDVSDAGDNGTSSIATTTQFQYSAEDVELKMMNGALTAFVGDKQVPYTGLANAADGTYVVENGVANTGFNGVFNADGKTCLIREGKVDATASGVVPADNGEWYLVQNGVVETSVTGIRDNQYGSWYVKGGKVQLGSDGLVSAEGSEYVIDGGKVATGVNGFQQVDEQWVMTEAGKVKNDYTGVQKNQYGKWYLSGGHVDFAYNGVARSDGSTYLIKEGRVDTSQNGVIQVDGTWAYVRDGMINTNFTGVASNQYGDWYVKNGIVQLGYDGVITANGGQRYNVSGGKASVVTTTRASNDNYSGGSGTGSRTQNNNVGSGIVGSSNSNVYHHSWCSYAKQIKGSNLIHFDSVSDAQSSGYHACKKCF